MRCRVLCSHSRKCESLFRNGMTIKGMSMKREQMYLTVNDRKCMVDAEWVRTNTNTWQTSRWPLPKPSAVRSNAQLKDTQGRSYVRMSGRNAVKLGINAGARWWWYALPVPSQRTEHRGQPVAVGERILIPGYGRRRVRAIGWGIERNRAVGIIDMS